MSPILSVKAGQASQAGRKAENQDSIGIRLPSGTALSFKGVAAVISDGVSACSGAREAAQACVTGMLSDYYSTPDSWSVETSASRVAGAINRWLHGEGARRQEQGHGMLCTLSTLILKSTTAYLFHVGDSRIYLLRGGHLEALTRDHHIGLGSDNPVLNRAMGADVNIDIDFRRLPLQLGDVFILTTDGVHEHLDEATIIRLASMPDLEQAAEAFIRTALDNGSPDNVSAQLLRVEGLPSDDINAHYERLSELRFPPPLSPGQCLDGYRVIRELHASKRTQVYLAVEEASGTSVALKTPSPNYLDDPRYIDQFLTEEWVARRIDSPHVLRFLDPPQDRRFLYGVTEYVTGPTLRSWMHDHPRPRLEEVRNIVAQIARGLRAFHRLEMVHQDLKPENVVIDGDGTVKIIDMGAVRVLGVEQISKPWQEEGFLGTASYAGPECLGGQAATAAADRYALGVITYEMLTGELPYNLPPAASLRRCPDYRSARAVRSDIPDWVDNCLRKAVAVSPRQRYEALSEFLRDLQTPNPALSDQIFQPLSERLDPATWRLIAGLSLVANLVLILLLMTVLE
ncbi:bifunctional protein-serine/threonine kinase/phosphatase [Hydrocarboniclastica marina]|uniref:Bifunctional protein-serine/threonine kinase/phosphatase n=1 Tax=Hydrocarboniclastica marina TaxID=2259620 RepID=A0A4P7XIW8_9ALTE|nr:bifunctional protein-serine/threonine kinase/phosphatase [Hydrocarboniclastica marina]QCF27049.1 bifunctional protein-serine/threonine kinase/phosphatase [Hydrocarboniclastica marina]